MLAHLKITVYEQALVKRLRLKHGKLKTVWVVNSIINIRNCGDIKDLRATIAICGTPTSK